MTGIRKAYNEIESELNSKVIDLNAEEIEPLDNEIDFLNRVITPLLNTARNSARSAGYSTGLDMTDVDPTITLEIYQDQVDEPSAIILYLTEHGIEMAYSVIGDSHTRQLSTIRSEEYSPNEACKLILDGIRKALEINDDEG